MQFLSGGKRKLRRKIFRLSQTGPGESAVEQLKAQRMEQHLTVLCNALRCLKYRRRMRISMYQAKSASPPWKARIQAFTRKFATMAV